MRRTSRSLITLSLAVLALTTWLPAAATCGAEPSAPSVSAFLDTLGVAIHAGYSDGAYANTTEIVADLDYIGIHQLRDGTPYPAGGIPYQNYRKAIDGLVKAGNRFAFVVGAGQTIAVSLSQIEEIEKGRPGAVIAVEGPNEINNAPVSFNGLTGEAGARAFQRALYAAVKANAALAHVPVYDFTGGSPIDLSAESGLADTANAHPYPNRGEAPGQRIADEFASLFGAYRPRVITETGYFDSPRNSYGSGVDSTTQAKLTLDLLFSAFEQGIAKTYLYQLRTAYPDPQGNNTDAEYGLFDLNNVPKPAAVALHNLTGILSSNVAETGHTNSPTPVYRVSSLPPNAHQLLMHRGHRGFVLVIWAEPAIWDEAAHRPIPSATETVTVSFQSRLRTARVFDPLIGMVPQQSYDDATTLQLSISDHPILVLASP